ncbi:MAG: hypothetical protein NTW86_12955 [Candidatus Sumerlaeota bacterium]|nr:hypothetical protein [Candidatus Sumerlaeota bacterium]
MNDMEHAGIIRRYAIGGALGALFYMEPVLTYDLDVFVDLPRRPGGLVSLAPAYDYLHAKGCKEDREHIIIDGTPVQLLVPYNALIEEALAEARATVYGQTPTRVFRAEHLAAIMLQTGRPKDRARLAGFCAEATYDKECLAAILDRHGLAAAWVQWRGEG